MDTVLVYLLSNGSSTIYNKATDGFDRMDINKIDLQVYVSSDSLDEFVERMITGNHFSAYHIPSKANYEVVFSGKALECEKLLEFPVDYDWDFIESNLPDYYSNSIVAESNDLDKYLSGEMVDGEDDAHVSYIEAGCPSYLTLKEWAYHQQKEVDGLLYREAKKAITK